MSKVFIETIATLKHLYIIEAETEEEALETYAKAQNDLLPKETQYIGELLSDVYSMCDDHYQEYLNSLEDENDDEEEEQIEKICISELN